MNMMFSEWTYELVRAQIIEAAFTLRASPGDLGPRLRSGAMSEVVRDMMESYGYQNASVRRIPSAGAISRMHAAWDWINEYLNEEERKRVYEYAFIRTRKGMYLDQYLRKIGISRRTFDRRIQADCQRIADALNQKHRIRLTTGFDDLTQIDLETTSITVASKSCATFQRSAEVDGQKDTVRAEVLERVAWRNERRRQLLERAER